MKAALVLSGGGAHGAYEVGVIKALIAGLAPSTGHRPLEIGAIAATSIGAFNAAVLLSNFGGDWTQAAAALESAWLDRIAADGVTTPNGVFRYRPNVPVWVNVVQVARDPLQQARELMSDTAFLARDWVTRLLGFAASSEGLGQRFAELVDLSTFLTPEPSEVLVEALVSPVRLRTSSVSLSVTATAWKSGTLRVFANTDFNDADAGAIVRASGAIPGIFPAVSIDGEPYVDGGVVMNTPLKPAIDAGADTLHVIYLDPAPGVIPLRRVGSTIDAMERMFVSSFAATMRRDLDVAARVNREIAQGRTSVHKPLAIHLYHPTEDTGGALGILDFDRVHVTTLVDLGYKNAVTHNCRKAGCLNVT
jgi:NTE family protein